MAEPSKPARVRFGGGRNKYRAKPTIYNGVRYASKAEAARAEALDALVGMRLVAFWVPQPTFRLGCPENVYRADFLVVDADGAVWVEDVKGVETAKFRRDKKLWAAYGPCRLHILGRRAPEYVEGGARRLVAGEVARG
jgi:hypothetical protein